MTIFARTAALVQEVLTTTAEEMGRAHGLIQRRRRFTASSLLTTFVLGFLQHANPSCEQLALIARQAGADVTPQAVLARITPALRDCLRRLWLEVIDRVVRSEGRAAPLLRKFTHVFIGDSTTLPLTDALADEFAGCGGAPGAGRAAMKLQVVWDVLSGGLWRLTCAAGKENDSASLAALPAPPAGSLSVFDLGYFALERFGRWREAGAHWISRGISDLLVFSDGQTHDLHAWLARQPAGPIDLWVEVGAARLPCRLVALRAPSEVAARRRQQAHAKAAKKGRQPTARHLATCDWTVFLTSCDDALLTWKEVVVLYRVRWQIELLFKLWKSHGLLEQHRSDDPVRQLVELYAKLIGVVLQHWLLLTTCWRDARLSLVRAARLIRDQLPQLIAALPHLGALTATLERWAHCLTGLARIAKRRAQPSNPQLLLNPELLTFNT